MVISSGCLQHLNSLLEILKNDFIQTNLTVIAKETICNELYYRYKNIKIIEYESIDVFNSSDVENIIVKRTSTPFDSCIVLMSNLYGIDCNNIFNLSSLSCFKRMYSFYINSKFSIMDKIIAQKYFQCNHELDILCKSFRSNQSEE